MTIEEHELNAIRATHAADERGLEEDEPATPNAWAAHEHRGQLLAEVDRLRRIEETARNLLELLEENPNEQPAERLMGELRDALSSQPDVATTRHLVTRLARWLDGDHEAGRRAELRIDAEGVHAVLTERGEAMPLMMPKRIGLKHGDLTDHLLGAVTLAVHLKVNPNGTPFDDELEDDTPPAGRAPAPQTHA